MKRTMKNPTRALLGAAAAALATLPSSPANAGTWGDPGTSVFAGNATSNAAHDVTLPNCIPWTCSKACNADVPPGACPTIGFIPGFYGWSYGRIAEAKCKKLGTLGTHCYVYGNCHAEADVRGIGTSTAEILWNLWADNERDCDCAPYVVQTDADLTTTFDLRIDTVPPGDPVTVYFSWYAIINRQTEHEAGAEDPAFVNGTPVGGPVVLNITVNNGPPTALINNVAVNANDPNALLFLPANPGMATGVIAAHGGDTISIDIQGAVSARMAAPADGTHDVSRAGYTGRLMLSIDDPLPPFQNPAVPGASINEFSVKIGSDAEMSDPTLSGNEVFDPGDTYPWYGPPLPPCGADGVRDDALALTADYWPLAPDCNPDPLAGGSGAETCTVPFNSFSTAILDDRFDLDGTDALDVELRLMLPTDGNGNPLPLATPLAQFQSSCIYGPDPFLLISYADDGPAHYAVDFCQVPSRAPSSISRTYGTSARNDEVVMTLTSAGSVPPQVSFAGTVPVLSEMALHPSLAPNPNPANPFDPIEQEEDDDVDALDVNVNNTAQCEHWYICADKEATAVDQNGLPLEPASIYEVLTGGGVVKIIDGLANLGLPLGTDVDAFEFVWLRQCDMNQTNCQNVLGLLFSVDEDDGVGILDLMPGDESGGLDPTKIYASYLDGAWFEYSPDPLGDNVDAIAASSLPFIAAGAVSVVNDDCFNATSIGTGVTAFSNQYATTDGPPACGFLGDIAGNSDSDIWYEYVAPCDGLATFSFAPQFEQLLAIYDGSCPGGAAPLACDTILAGDTRHITLAVVAGQTYTIRIGGVNGRQGYGTMTIDCPCDSFDSYSPLFLVTAQSAWEPWNGNAAAAGFLVTTAQAHSAPQALVIDGADDAVHRYYDRTSGRWRVSAWVYVPTGMTGQQYFILVNTYPTVDLHDWSLQVELNGATDTVDDLDSPASLPMVRDQWVEIAAEIDLNADTQSVYYDGQLLVNKSWTDGVAAGGAAQLEALDLWANGSTAVYYDDVCVQPGQGLVGDINGDGVVDALDYLALIAAWGPCPAPCPPSCPADFNGDCVVDAIDFLMLIANWS